MAKRMRKAVKYGINVAKKAKARVEKELKALAKAGIINKTEAKKIMKAIINEAKQEKKRIMMFAKQELKREAKKAKPLIKKAVKRWKKARKR